MKILIFVFILICFYIETFSQIQSDSSDNVFKIVMPLAVSHDIDMGNVVVQTYRDSLIKAFITNNGSYDNKITDIIINGTNASDFKLTSIIIPFVLKPKESREVEFRFYPKSIGIKTADITIYTQADTINQKITGTGVVPNLFVLNKVIDFGKIMYRTYKDTIQAVTIKNISNSPVNIKSTKHSFPNSTDFTTLSGGGPFTLAPGEESRMDLRFKPSDKGRTSGTILFDFDGNGSPAIVELLGEAYRITPRITTNSPVCIGDNILLFADSIEGATYHWSGPYGFNSNSQNVIIGGATELHSGKYRCYYTVNGIVTDTTEIDVLVSTMLVSPGDSSLIFVGSSSKTDNTIIMNKSREWDGGSVWLRNRFSIKKDFATTFKFRYRYGSNNKPEYEDGSLPGADGFAFVIQNQDRPYLGEKGGSMGYPGIPNSLAIEYDLYQNGWDPNGNHVAVQSLGDKPNTANHIIPNSLLVISDQIITIEQDKTYYSKIDYNWNEKKLNIFIDSTGLFDNPVLTINSIDLANNLNLINGEYVYIGFTSGTGYAYQQHEIIDWVIPCYNQLVSVEEQNIGLNENNKFVIYPNPANQIINIKSYYLPINKIEVYNILGQLINQHNIDDINYQLDISYYPVGYYYFIMYFNDNSSKVDNFIISK